MNAIKVARAYTGRPKIIKCENSYHGSYDFAEVSLDGKNDPHSSEPISTAYSHGTPRVLENVIVIPFNDAELASKIIEKNVDQVVAILFDPFGQKYGRSFPLIFSLIHLKKPAVTLIFYSLRMRLFPSEQDILVVKRERN